MSDLPTLYIGNKNYSSWSMRPWLALRWANIGFEESMIELRERGGGVNPDIAAISPSGTVPVLKLADGETIWDTMSICEWAHEQAPGAGLWPQEPIARAIARSAAAEMHAGFGPLRQAMPMNIRRRKAGHVLSDDVKANIARIDDLLSGMRKRFDHSGTGWLFGQCTIADAFYAPVATRFRTYNVPLKEATHAWCETLFADTAFRSWEADAVGEPSTIGETDEA